MKSTHSEVAQTWEPTLAVSPHEPQFSHLCNGENDSRAILGLSKD